MKRKSYRNFAQDSWPNKVSVFISGDLDIPPVQQHLGSFLHAQLNQGLHPLPGLRRDQGSHVRTWLITFGKGDAENYFCIVYI